VRVLAFAAALLAAGCFQPRVDDGHFTCADDGSCPPGFHCSSCDDLCWVDPSAHTCDAPPAVAADGAVADARVASPTDGRLDSPPPPDALAAPADGPRPDAPLILPDAPPLLPDGPLILPDAPPPDAPLVDVVDAEPGSPDARAPADARLRPPDAALDAPPPDAPPIDAPPIDATPPPDAVPPDAAPRCGDHLCQPWVGEDCVECPGDCGSCNGLCVANLCLLGQTCVDCPTGCGKCVCNGTCEGSDATKCPTDCQ
jgi:hypothetical protein